VFYLGHVTYLYDRTSSTTYAEWYFGKPRIIGTAEAPHYFSRSWTAQALDLLTRPDAGSGAAGGHYSAHRCWPGHPETGNRAGCGRVVVP
jgi:hypothetical protein